MRVGVVTDLTAANSMYRAVAIEELRSRGHEVRVVASDRARAAELRDCDVVHVYRDHDERTRQLATTLRTEGVAITWDNDDDYSAGPEGTRGAIRRGGIHAQRFLSEMSRMMQLADVVTTTSPLLAEDYRTRGAERVEVVENYLPACYRAPEPARREDVVVGWVAGNEHLYDLRHLGIAETLQRLLGEHERMRVVSIGLDLRFADERYRYIPRVQYGDLAGCVAGFDVGIAPLADIRFNRARSNVKLKEYAGAGVPWLASPIGPYRGLGEKQGGRLVADDGWDDALRRLVAGARERRKLGKRAAKWARGQTVARNLDRWERALAGAVEAARAGRRPGRAAAAG